VADLFQTEDEDLLRTYGDTIQFLDKEGFISYEAKVVNEAFYGVTLSSKGLALLNSVPQSLHAKEILACKLKQAVGEGSRELVRAAVEGVLRQALGG